MEPGLGPEPPTESVRFLTFHVDIPILGSVVGSKGVGSTPKPAHYPLQLLLASGKFVNHSGLLFFHP